MQKMRVRQFSGRAPLRGSAVLGCLVLLIVLGPVVTVLALAFQSNEPIWGHLGQTVLPRYLATTLRVTLGVALLSGAIGAGAAWIVSAYHFPGRWWLRFALAFPMAIPGYVAAYALVDFLDYSGLVQTTLRSVMGWTSAQDYWFFQVRSEAMAIIVLSSVLYPYSFLLVRSAFREQSGNVFEAARSLGLGHFGVFWRLALPIARPALATGMALAMMEAVADFGTVAHFGVQTLTTGIFSTWLTGGNVGGAAQLALVALVLILGLTLIERQGRAKARYYRQARAARPMQRQSLTGWRGWLAFLACFLPFGLGFLLPVGVMITLGGASFGSWPSEALLNAGLNSFLVGVAVAVLTVGSATALVNAVHVAGPAQRLLKHMLPLTGLGYAAPGAVLALGVLIPLARIDHGLADFGAFLTGRDIGLILTGTGFAIVLACSIRFFGIALGAMEATWGRVPPSLPQAARSLGESRFGALRRVQLPLMRGSILTVLLLIFVDTLKELPATLLLRPFNYETLATRTYELVSLERLEEAAPAALIIIAFGLLAVWALVRLENEKGQGD